MNAKTVLVVGVKTSKEMRAMICKNLGIENDIINKVISGDMRTDTSPDGVTM